jgi:hypothetical protein
MLSATTVNSRSVTIDYRVDQTADRSDPLTFAVYRSRSPWLGADSRLVDTWNDGAIGVNAALLDEHGQPATALGIHQLTIPVPGRLPIDPQQPYVLVVADPGQPGTSVQPQQTASFRTYVIGIVTHGGLINPSWKHGPPWELQIATILKQQGYDAVIPFNWVSASSEPGHAAVQGRRLTHEILQVASRFPATAPVDLHFIGHSEGAVVNTQAIVALQQFMTPQIRAGYIQDTLLDPHAANNDIPAQSSTGSGFLGGLARAIVTNYQARANDPHVFIPAIVDSAQVFYQHTAASHDHGLNQGLYNLWGQVPVPNLSGSPVTYYNLTAAGAVHSGDFGVALWYRNFVAPTLGSQEPLVQTLRLSGELDGLATPTPVAMSRVAQRRTEAWGPAQDLLDALPVFSGTSAPWANIRVDVGPASRPWSIDLLGQTTADAQGKWTLSTRVLPHGQYRAIAMAYAPALRTRPGLTIVSVDPLGRFVVPTHTRALGSKRSVASVAT